MTDAARFLNEHGIAEVECLVPDLNGILRGKVVPSGKLAASPADAQIMLPSSALTVTVTGNYSGAVDDESVYQDADMRLAPDLSSLYRAPDAGRAYVFADAFAQDGTPWPSAPRQMLKAVLDLYAARGWRPVVAPELEFYLTGPSADPAAGLPIWGQLLILGTIVNLTFSLADVVCVLLASVVVARLRRSGRAQRLMQRTGGTALIGLGAHLALQRN